MCPRWVVTLLAVLALSAATITLVAGSSSASTAATDAITPASSCAQLATADFNDIAGAPAEISSATALAPSANPDGAWAACQVTGIIAPETHFELLLPTATYQGEYLQVGCGGLCGNAGLNMVPAANNCVPLTSGAFALASDDEGHEGGAGLFAADMELRAEFGYQSEHQLALAAKAIIADFYGQAAKESYYDGCSDGGREGLLEAQRYPRDFNGIVAGAPAAVQTELNTFFEAWDGTADLDATGAPILTTADLTPLHNAVLKACGDSEGVVIDPLACTWDPAGIRCTAASTGFCLTPAQVAVVDKFYAGPRDSNGNLFYPGYMLRGSELNWAGMLVPAAGGTPGIASIAEQFLRFAAYPEAHPTETAAQLPFTDAEFGRLMALDKGMYDATDPDLSAFKAAGGKLILWHGAADMMIPTTGTLAYYQAVTQRMGGLAATESFARLFLLPGVAHCGGGQGPDQFDGLDAITDWVTKGQAPASLTTTLTSGGSVTESRPVYPYPYVAQDTTGGDPAKAASYTPVLSTAEQHFSLRWLGSFSSGYENWCGWNDGTWVCRTGRY